MEFTPVKFMAAASAGLSASGSWRPRAACGEVSEQSPGNFPRHSTGGAQGIRLGRDVLKSIARGSVGGKVAAVARIADGPDLGSMPVCGRNEGTLGLPR